MSFASRIFSALFFNWLIFFGIPAVAQKEANNWLFVTRAGINFNSNPPQPILNGKTFGYMNSASISDVAGSLLFYYSGGGLNSNDTIYNRNHQAMPNGHGFANFGNITSLIVPWPGQQKYYLFNGITEFTPIIKYKNGYSVIDMNLNNGLGDVTAVKNKVLNDTSFYASVAVQHRNMRDYWVIYQKNPIGTFYAYQISPAGLDTIPVISNVSKLTPNPNTVGRLLKASPDGKTLAFIYWTPYSLTQDSISFLNFDPVTGTVSKNFSMGILHATSMEFSPDGSKFYCVRNDTIIPGLIISSNALY